MSSRGHWMFFEFTGSVRDRYQNKSTSLGNAARYAGCLEIKPHFLCPLTLMKIKIDWYEKRHLIRPKPSWAWCLLLLMNFGRLFGGKSLVTSTSQACSFCHGPAESRHTRDMTSATHSCSFGGQADSSKTLLSRTVLPLLDKNVLITTICWCRA